MPAGKYRIGGDWVAKENLTRYKVGGVWVPAIVPPVLPGANYQAAVIAANPVTYIPLQDATTTPTTAHGSSTWSVQGTTSSITTEVTGPMGDKGWNFHTTGAYLQSDNSGQYNGVSLTMMAWYRRVSAVGVNLASRWDGGPVWVTLGDGNMEFHRSNLTRLGYTTGDPRPTLDWYHITVRYTNDDAGPRFYINGVQNNTRQDGYNMVNNSNPLQLGAHNGGGSMRGHLAHFAYWNRALSLEEIQTIYAARV